MKQLDHIQPKCSTFSYLGRMLLLFLFLFNAGAGFAAHPIQQQDHHLSFSKKPASDWQQHLYDFDGEEKDTNEEEIEGEEAEELKQLLFWSIDVLPSFSRWSPPLPSFHSFFIPKPHPSACRFLPNTEAQKQQKLYLRLHSLKLDLA
ncbi:hypothetical protein PPO43_04785 [Saprospira sp. CCB-QB6]|uniref:hypothetical protein n=1 Tax=Saprospira sp. CCB-QB6 TaxID=3023936 RepID=UPI00234A92E6|nr:hypothetical protein [Saprospira sp. CCB-QB6]WCL82415.1 hypothetical protein PPO43_04785 [Saprospira sp. CCB-QB6]